MKNTQFFNLRYTILIIILSFSILVINQKLCTAQPCEPVQKLKADIPVGSDQFGFQVSLNGDKLAITAPGYNAGTGAVYILEKQVDGTWTEQNLINGNGGQYGWSVELTNDQLFVGAITDDFTTGYTTGQIYVYDLSNIYVPVQTLVPAIIDISDGFGWDIHVEGNTMICGAQSADAGAFNAGAAYVFNQDASGNWTEGQTLTASNAAQWTIYGQAVAIEGNHILVGDPQASVNGNDEAGAVYHYQKDVNGNWNEVAILSASDNDEDAWFGWSIEIENGRALIGAYKESSIDVEGGAVYYFELDASDSFQEIQKFTPAYVTFIERFGADIAIEGTTALISKERGDNVYPSEGLVYEFTLNTATNNWEEGPTFAATDPAQNLWFGSSSLAIENGIYAIGAYKDSFVESESGATYVFDTNCTSNPNDGCTDINACNFDATAVYDDGSCFLIGDTCDDNDINTTNDLIQSDCSCSGTSPSSCPGDIAGAQGAYVTTPVCAGDQSLAFIDLGSTTPAGYSNQTITTNANSEIVNVGAGFLDLTALPPGNYTLHLLIFDPNDALTPTDFQTFVGSQVSDVLSLIASGWCADLATNPNLLFNIILDDCNNPCDAEENDAVVFLYNQPVCTGDPSLGFIDLSMNYAIIVNANGTIVYTGFGFIDITALAPGSYLVHNLDYDLNDPLSPADLNTFIGQTLADIQNLINSGWCAFLTTDSTLLFPIELSNCGGVLGCIDINACNYDAAADTDDGSCVLIGDTCDDNNANTNNDIIQADCSCAGTQTITGCTNPNACNYNDNATTDDGSCFFIGDACDDNNANTNNDIIQADCSCAGTQTITGCTNPNACNYNDQATTDDGSCFFAGDNCDDNNPNTVNDIFQSDCSCLGEILNIDCSAGQFTGTIEYICANEMTNINAAGIAIENDSFLFYAVHDGDSYNIGNIYGISESGGWFINDGSLPTNVELCFTAIVGNNLQANGLPDSNGDCYDFSNCQSVVFFNPIEIVSEELCDEVTGLYDVEFSVSGGAPQYDPNQYNYSIYGSYSNQVSFGIDYSFGPLSDGSGYTLHVDNDGLGCSLIGETINVQCVKLPIELISFSGIETNNGNLLSWKTATEINNSHFNIYSSKNGNDFKLLTQIEGAGNTSLFETYSYLDNSNIFEITYYKLTQSDFDGTENYVGIVSVKRSKDPISEWSTMSIGSNQIVINSISNGASYNKARLNIYSLDGRIQHSSIIKLNGTTLIKDNSLIKGYYIAELTTPENQSSKKIYLR